MNLGADEISWKKNHNYLTLVSDHETSKIVWGALGKNAATMDGFFEEIGPENTATIEAVSMDMGLAFIKSVRAGNLRRGPELSRRHGHDRSMARGGHGLRFSPHS
ncbi:transposase [Pseudarthrobacter sp. Y6]|uniref:transposase n=1 Tax=Pseudarthrobacter sp. Y6 TaxID=3418422 RepID=UPI003CEDD0CC